MGPKCSNANKAEESHSMEARRFRAKACTLHALYPANAAVTSTTERVRRAALRTYPVSPVDDAKGYCYRRRIKCFGDPIQLPCQFIHRVLVLFMI